MRATAFSGFKRNFTASVLCIRDFSSEQFQVGSLAGAAHLLNNNAGVLRVAQAEQKSVR